MGMVLLSLSPPLFHSSHQRRQGLSIKYVPDTVLSTSYISSANPHHIPNHIILRPNHVFPGSFGCDSPSHFSCVWWPWSFWELLRDIIEYLSLWVGFLWRRPQRWVTFSTHLGYIHVHSNTTISSPHHLAKVQFPGFSLWTFLFLVPYFPYCNL